MHPDHNLPLTRPLRIGVIYGTRPEFIKLAPLITALNEDPRFEPVVFSTDQHEAMLADFSDIFDVYPDVSLHIFKQGQRLSRLASRLFKKLGKEFARTNLDAAVVQGDTTSAAIAAQVAYYHGVPVIHLEAGLRSHNLKAPFPEEGNRRMISQITSLHLAPTALSRKNLRDEGVKKSRIAITGNTVIDALLQVRKSFRGFEDPELNRIYQSDARILLVTCHRRENWRKLDKIGRALATIAKEHPEFTVVLPTHGNPLLRKALEPHLVGLDNLYLSQALRYEQFIALLERAEIALSDSGGIQEEGPFVHTPVLCMRSSTERPEGVIAGGVKLVGTKPARIVAAFNELATDPEAYARMAHAENPYGNGDAAIKSVQAIARAFAQGQLKPLP